MPLGLIAAGYGTMCYNLIVVFAIIILAVPALQKREILIRAITQSVCYYKMDTHILLCGFIACKQQIETVNTSLSVSSVSSQLRCLLLLLFLCFFLGRGGGGCDFSWSKCLPRVVDMMTYM